MARDCKTCKHSIFDENWGEWKCSQLKIVVKPSQYRKCGGYTRDKDKSREKRTP